MSKRKTNVNEAAPELNPVVEAVSAPEIPAIVDAAPEPTPEANDAPAPKRKGAKRKAKASDATLADLAEGYLKHLEEIGRSNGTVFSYRLELAVALDELGADTKAIDLTPERVVAFLASDRVNLTRSGTPKARVSVAKTTRVLRQSLQWAAEAGLIAKAPIPEDAASY